MRKQGKSIYLLFAALAVIIGGCSMSIPQIATKANLDASLAGDLPSNPLAGWVITSWVDHQDSTTSTMYGDELAVRYARNNSQDGYPPGSMLSIVTWNQQDDDRWFGGKIPASPKSVEYIAVSKAADHQPSYFYQRYEGTPLKKVFAQEVHSPDRRITYLLSQRAAVMP
jgi:hypothetical protein